MELFKLKHEVGRLISLEYSEQIFSVHPDAEQAYLYSKQLNRQYNLDLLTVDFVKTIQAITPLFVIKSSSPEDHIKPDQYLFYSNWVWLDLIKHHKIPNLCVLEIEESEVEDIEILAWSYVASDQLLAINHKENFRELLDVLQRISTLTNSNPVHEKAKKVSGKTIERLSGVKRGVIRGQKRKDVLEASALESYISNNPRGL